MIASAAVLLSCLALAEPPATHVAPIAVLGRPVNIPGLTWSFRTWGFASIASPTSGTIVGEFDLPGGSVVSALVRFDASTLTALLKTGDTTPDLPSGTLTIGNVTAGVAAPDGSAVAFVNTGAGGTVVQIAPDGRRTTLLCQDRQVAGLPDGVVFSGPGANSPPLVSTPGGLFAWDARVRGGNTVGSGEAAWCWDAAHGLRLIAVSGTPLPGRPAAPLSIQLLGLSGDGVLIGGSDSEFSAPDFGWVWRDGSFEPVAIAGQPVSAAQADWTFASGPSLLTMGADGTVAYRASVRPTARPQDPATTAFLVKKAGVSVLVAKIGDQVPGMRSGVTIARFTAAQALDDGRLAIGLGMIGPGIVTSTSTGNDSLSAVWGPGERGSWGPDGFIMITRKGDLAPGPCGYIYGYPGNTEPTVTSLALGHVSAARIDTYRLGQSQSSRTDLYLTDLNPIGTRRGILSDGLVTWDAWAGGGASTARLSAIRFVSTGTPGLRQQPLISADGRIVLELNLTDGSRGLYLTDPLRFPAASMADANEDDFLDHFDLWEFVGWLEVGDERADYNRDRFIDFFDYLEFVEAFESGC